MAKIDLYAIINEHELDGSTAWGNGGHGHCKHCRLALVTDLGYDSWSGVKCIDRIPVYTGLYSFPPIIISYANFNGLMYNATKKIFTKPYTKDKYTIKQLVNKINSLQR